MPWLADELAAPAATRVSLALAGGLGAIVAVERHRLRSLTRSTLFVRWRTWLLTAPLFGAAVLWSPWLALGFVTALAVQGVREYARLTRLPPSYRGALMAGALAAPAVAMWSVNAWLVLPAIATAVLTVVPIVRQHDREGARHTSFTLFGFVWIPWALATFVLLRERVPGGAGVLLALGTAVAASDVVAFAAGSAFGRDRLAGRISPAKTWEGVAGNIAGAYAGFLLMGFALPALPLGVRLSLPLIVGVACVWGDLVESLVKRQFGEKDAGSWLPGFGGLLDRIDSLLIALPLTTGIVAVTT